MSSNVVSERKMNHDQLLATTKGLLELGAEQANLEQEAIKKQKRALILEAQYTRVNELDLDTLNQRWHDGTPNQQSRIVMELVESVRVLKLMVDTHQTKVKKLEHELEGEVSTAEFYESECDRYIAELDQKEADMLKMQEEHEETRMVQVREHVKAATLASERIDALEAKLSINFNREWCTILVFFAMSCLLSQCT
jgi:hypothetical protein